MQLDIKNICMLTVTSSLQYEKLKKLYGFTADNIAVIPPGTDIHHFCPFRQDKNKTA